MRQLRKLMGVRLRKTAVFLFQSSLLGHIVVLFWQGEKSGLRLVTFHLCIKDHRPKTEVERRNRSQAESNQSPAPVDWYCLY